MLIIADLTGNRRDVATGAPKALLTNIEGFNREHCWVIINEELNKHQPAGHKRPIKIQFEAKLKKYPKRGNEVGITLSSITNIKRIK